MKTKENIFYIVKSTSKFAHEYCLFNGMPRKISVENIWYRNKDNYHDGKRWSKFPFDFDPHIVAEIVKQHLKKQDVEDPYACWDGSSELGFRMKAIDNVFSDEKDGIKNPFFGIVSIEPEYIFYAK